MYRYQKPVGELPHQLLAHNYEHTIGPAIICETPPACPFVTNYGRVYVICTESFPLTSLRLYALTHRLLLDSGA